MKPFSPIICLVLFGLTFFKSQAQYSLDMYSIVPVTKLNNGTLGLGINFYSKPFSLNSSTKKEHADILFGAGFYGSGLNKCILKNVPLQLPQEGTSKITMKNSIYGFNVSSRISVPLNKNVRAYAGMQLGWREFSSDITILPDAMSNGTRKQTTQNILSFDQFTYGYSAGFLIALDDGVKLDVGAVYNTANTNANMLDLQTAHVEANSLVVNKMTAPTDLVMVKLGIFCFLDSSNKGGGSHSQSGHYHACHHSSFGGSSHVHVVVS